MSILKWLQEQIEIANGASKQHFAVQRPSKGQFYKGQSDAFEQTIKQIKETEKEVSNEIK